MRTRVYIAAPMTQGCRITNMAEAMKAFKTLIESGYAPLCPSLTYFAEPFIKQPPETWLAIELLWVRQSNALLRLPGVSTGADQEADLAHSLGIPIFYNLDELLLHLHTEP